LETLSFLGLEPDFGDALSVRRLEISVTAGRDAGGGVSLPSNKLAVGGGWDWDFERAGREEEEEERDCFTTARGTESSEGEESESRSSRMLGSWGGMGDRTQRFEEYFVRMKFSILESEGMWEGGKDASQYLA